MTSPDYVLFDCDGVLVDSEPLTDQIMRDDLADHGLDISVHQINALFLGGTMQGAMDQSRQMGANLPDDWLAWITDKIHRALAQHCQVIPGVVDVLDQLDAAGIGYAVGSNGPVAKMDVTLTKTGLTNRFAGLIFSAHDCAAAKPAPDVYLKAAALAGIDPTRCAVIEDSASGARAGQAAGARVFGYAADTPAEKLAPYCDVVFDDMSKLPGLLGLPKR